MTRRAMRSLIFGLILSSGFLALSKLAPPPAPRRATTTPPAAAGREDTTVGVKLATRYELRGRTTRFFQRG